MQSSAQGLEDVGDNLEINLDASVIVNSRHI